MGFMSGNFYICFCIFLLKWMVAGVHMAVGLLVQNLVVLDLRSGTVNILVYFLKKYFIALLLYSTGK